MSVVKLNVIVIGIVLGISAIFSLCFMLPGTKTLAAKEKEIGGEIEQVKNKQAELGNVGELYTSIQEMDQQMQDFREKLPPDKAFGEFLRDVSENLKKEGIDDFVVQPQPPLRIDETQLPPTFEPAKGTVVLPVELQFETSFEKVFSFLSHMDALTRISNVESLSLINNESKPGQVRVEMMLQTYQHQQ
jgi:Tfp pilus assembly protein PilO